ncbi:conjugal transfer protein TraE, partial [Alistipes onderdonkii]|nr:conjugal transfer protein TraE [Alistipes onderdonkii]
AHEMDGEVVQISGDSHTYINPFDLELVEGEQPLAMKVDAIMSMVEMMAKNLSPMQKTLVDRCVSRIYDRYFATHDQRDIPTLIDFYNML